MNSNRYQIYNPTYHPYQQNKYFQQENRKSVQKACIQLELVSVDLMTPARLSNLAQLEMKRLLKSVFSDKLVYYSTKTTLGLTIYNIHPPMNRSYSQFYIFTKNLFKVQSPLWNSPNAPFVRLVLFYFHSSCWLYLVITKILSCLVRSSVILIN